MAELKPAQIDSFYKSFKSPKHHFYLFVGTDKNLASDRMATLFQLIRKSIGDAHEAITLDDNTYQETPERLFVEMGMTSMFGDRKVIQTPLHKKLDTKELANLITQETDDFLLIYAPGMKKTTALYKKFSTNPNCMVLASYPFSSKEVGTYLLDELEEKSITASPELFARMRDILATDRGIIRQEVDKLSLYLGERSEITQEDIAALWHNSHEPTLDEIISGFAAKDAKKTFQMLSKAMSTGIPISRIVIALTNHFLLLHKLVSARAVNPQQVVAMLKQMRPPVHFSRHDDFIHQARQYKMPEVVNILSDLQKLTIDMRTNNQLHMEKFERLVLDHCHK